MAFDPNTLPTDLKSLNIARTMADEPRISPNIDGLYVNSVRDVNSPRSVPVYYPTTVSEAGMLGLGYSNAVPGVAGWIPRMPVTGISPAGANPGNPAAGFSYNSSAVSRSDQASDEGGDDSVSGKKVKFLCSFGGKILPRPSDGALRYVGGQTRIISVKKDVTFNELVRKMTDTYGQNVIIKYQLPDEDLDALVLVSCPDDLDNMMDEYEKLAARSSEGSAKLRVFLFSASELDASSSLIQVGDLQDSSQRYVEAVNGVVDGVISGGITRRESIASGGSTQNSEFSVTDGFDSMLLGIPDVNSPAPTGKLPPPVYVEVSTAPFSIPAVGSSGPPPPVLPQVVNYPPQPAPYMQETLNRPEYVQMVNYPPPQPVFTQPRYIPVVQPMVQPHQVRFEHYPEPVQSYNAYQTPRPVVWHHPPPQLSHQLPQVSHQPSDQISFSEGWVTHPHVTLSDKVQRVDDCVMCQKALPHAHSDTIAHGVKEIPSDLNPVFHSLQVPGNIRAERSQVEGIVVPQNFDGLYKNGNNLVPKSDNLDRPQVSPPHIQSPYNILPAHYQVKQDELPKTTTYVDTAPQISFTNDLVRQVDGKMENLHIQNHPEADNFQPSNFQEVFPVSNLESAQVIERTLPIGEWKDNSPRTHPNLLDPSVVESLPSNSDFVSSLSASARVGDIQDGSDSLFSNQDPWNMQQDNHFPPPRPNKILMRKESFGPRDPFENRFGNIGESLVPNPSVLTPDLRLDDGIFQPSGNFDADFGLENGRPIKDGSAEEKLKQELQAVAEGVAANVLQSSTPSIPDIEGQNSNLELQLGERYEDTAKLSGKINIGFPASDSLGRLQIIKNDDLEELRELGSGTFGTVYHGKWRGSDVAIKRINDRCFAGKPSEQDRMREDFWNEAIKLADLHHPNVVAFYGVVIDGPGGTVATVTEYMVNGSLRTALQKNERNLDKRKRLIIAMDVAFGMEYLHGKNIVHFDLKSDNLLVNLRDPHRPICKVGDLGLSKVKCQTLISGGVRGTLPWMAPELLNGSSSLVSEKVDVFSFGIVLWELLTGDEPYADLHYGAIIGGIVNNTLRPPIPESCDPDWKILMERCWSAEPSERPNFTDVANQLRSMASKSPPKVQNPQLPKT
jgi:tRNA A-37 threonylcarbamoyl transferase component Bud32